MASYCPIEWKLNHRLRGFTLVFLINQELQKVDACRYLFYASQWRNNHSPSICRVLNLLLFPSIRFVSLLSSGSSSKACPEFFRKSAESIYLSWVLFPGKFCDRFVSERFGLLKPIKPLNCVKEGLKHPLRANFST